MAPDPSSTGRRAYDEHGATVVSLREYLEEKIDSSHKELLGEIEKTKTALAADVSQVRTDVATGHAQSSREHAQVQRQLADLSKEVALLTAADLREEGARKSRGRLFGGAQGLVAIGAAVCAIAVAVIDRV